MKTPREPLDRERATGGRNRLAAGRRRGRRRERRQIIYAGPARAAPAVPPTPRIDARGGTDHARAGRAHFHPTYFNVAELADLDIKYPVEFVTILAACNAKLALECGYTSARSGGSLHNIDVWLKKAIEEDLIPGPRLAANGREICGAGGLMDWNSEHSEARDGGTHPP